MRRTIGFLFLLFIIAGMAPRDAGGYTLTMSVNPSGSGTTSPAIGPHTTLAKSVAITATPNAGYRFVNWTGAHVADPNSASTSVAIFGDQTVTANFIAVYTLTMQVSPAGGGTTNPAVGAYDYDAGTVVNVTATPAVGYRFDYWSGGVANTGNASTTVTMTGNKTVSACFKKQWTVTLNINPAGTGTWNNDAGNLSVGAHVYDEGVPLYFHTHPAAGYMFVQWTGDWPSSTVPDDPQNPTHLRNIPDGLYRDMTFTANFAPARTLTLNVNPPAGGGTFPPSPYQWPEGYPFDIQAEPNPGYAFVNWTANFKMVQTNQAHTTITLASDGTVTANFIAVYTLTMQSPSGSGTTSPAVGTTNHNQGTVVNLTATPAAGWRFDHWEGEVANGSNASTTVTMTGNKTVRPLFTQQWTLTLNVDPPGTGNFNNESGNAPLGPRLMDDGTYIHYNAVPVTDYLFVKWTGDLSTPIGQVPDITPPHIFETDMHRNWNVTANFALARTLTLNVNPPEGGGTFPPSPYQWPEGYPLDIQAEPNPGYVFVNWTANFKMVQTNQAHTEITFSGNGTVTANFAPATTMHTLTMSTTPDEGGTTDPAAGAHEYAEGTVVNVTATPAAGYRFYFWSGEVANIGNSVTTVTMTGNKTVSANFVKQWTVTLNTNPAGAGTWGDDTGDLSVGAHVYDEGLPLNFHVHTETGYLFVRWTDDWPSPSSMVPVDPQNPTHLRNIEGGLYTDLTFTANFAPIRTLTISDNPPEGGSTLPGSPYMWPQGYPVDIWAEPNPGYVFLNWTGDLANVTDPNQAHTSIMMNTDAAVTANYVPASGVRALGLPLPKTFNLSQNYPNPFNPETKILCELPQPGSLTVSVYGTTGRIVRTLVDRQMAAGTYEVIWDGRDEYGNSLPTGIYFCRMKAENKVFIKKMALTK